MQGYKLHLLLLPLSPPSSLPPAAKATLPQSERAFKRVRETLHAKRRNIYFRAFVSESLLFHCRSVGSSLLLFFVVVMRLCGWLGKPFFSYHGEHIRSGSCLLQWDQILKFRKASCKKPCPGASRLCRIRSCKAINSRNHRQKY